MSPDTLSQAHYTPPANVGLQRPWGMKPIQTASEETCLTQAIYYEAGNEPSLGKEAVALVILNRLGQKPYARTICGVVHQSLQVNGQKICQFSYHCLPKYKPNPDRWKESQSIARKSLKNIFTRDTLMRIRDSRYFHATYVNPRWAKQKLYVTQIGDHIFYQEPPAQ
jgi:spore germination cell wall hydrolase CwlJ-like protein